MTETKSRRRLLTKNIQGQKISRGRDDSMTQNTDKSVQDSQDPILKVEMSTDRSVADKGLSSVKHIQLPNNKSNNIQLFTQFKQQISDSRQSIKRFAQAAIEQMKISEVVAGKQIVSYLDKQKLKINNLLEQNQKLQENIEKERENQKQFNLQKQNDNKSQQQINTLQLQIQQLTTNNQSLNSEQSKQQEIIKQLIEENQTQQDQLSEIKNKNQIFEQKQKELEILNGNLLKEINVLLCAVAEK